MLEHAFQELWKNKQPKKKNLKSPLKAEDGARWWWHMPLNSSNWKVDL